MLLIRCKFKCYIHHFIIYSDLNNVLNFCYYVWSLTMFWIFATLCPASMLPPTKHSPSKTPWSRKHSSTKFNNAKDIFVCIQFVTIDWCNSRFSASVLSFSPVCYKICYIFFPHPHKLKIQGQEAEGGKTSMVNF